MTLRPVAALAAILVTASASDWPQWRGPHRDGIAEGFAAPQVWPEKLERKWKIEVGEGHSSPVFADGKIYVHTRQGEREVLRCLRPENGQTIWEQTYDEPYTVNPAAERHGKGVKSTPVVQDGRIFTFGINGTLSCFDAATGKPQWRKEFGAPGFGTAMSPMIDRGLLIAHVGKTSSGALTAFDPKTGVERWSWKGDAPAYASPILVELGGVRQIVTQSRSKIVSVDASTGGLLWSMQYTTAYEQNIVTPVVWHDLLIFSGVNNGVMAVKAAKTVWQNKDVSMYMSSPVVVGDSIFGFSHRNKGQFFCLDAATGSTRWTSDGRQGDNAAVVAAGSVLLLLTTEAELIVARNSAKSYEVLRKYTVADSPTWAHPVPVGKGILIKDATTLALWNLP